MTTSLADSSVLVDHLRGREEARRLVDAALDAGRPMRASVMSRVEIGAGLVARQRERAELLFEGVEWVAVTHDIADLAGEFARRFRRSHAAIDIADYVIAATAVLLDADLLTHNVKHFPMFPDLEAPY